MLIIPIGHEHDTVRRLPWVTFAIMAGCLMVHIIVSIQMAGVRKNLEVRLKNFVVYCLEHPYLEPNRESIIRLLGEQKAEEFLTGLGMLRAKFSREEPADTQEEQEEFDRVTLDLVHTMESVPTRTLGYIPARRNALGLLTYMFVHGGWLHLLGNLLLLYLTAPFIEDVWGRPLFLAFYLTAGVFSALAFGLHYPHLEGPLIGASGAIAGVMGAFLVRFWKTKIEFFYLIFFFVRGTFSAPAFVMFPLWFLFELFNAHAMDVVNPGSGGGVAHWAHVWGFALGVVTALVMMKLKVEEHLINPKIEAKVSYVDGVSEFLEEVLRKKMERRYDEAFTQALSLAQKNPGREDVVRVLWGLSVEMGRQGEAAKWEASLIEREVRRDQMDAALEDFRSLRRAATGVSISPGAKIALVWHLIKTNAVDEAKELAAESLAQLDGNAPPGLLIETVKLSASLNSSALARKAIELCLLSPDIPADQKTRLKEYLGSLSPAGH